MRALREKISNFYIIKILNSAKIAVVCLFLLFVLTFWGTLYQVEHGLYQAQERFFHSWYFMVFGFFPFPGAQMIFLILFINILCVLFFRFVYNWSNLGILLIHCGLLLILSSAFITFRYGEESQLTLTEGEGSNLSSAYHQWELAVWKEEESAREVLAYDTHDFLPGKILNFDEFHLDVIVERYYPNAHAHVSDNTPQEFQPINASGIHSLEETPFLGELEKNLPGGVLQVRYKNQKVAHILLFGGEWQPTRLDLDNTSYYFIMRRKKFVLPFTLKLLDFRMEMHPGTQVARSYESQVEIITPGASRETVIYMNHPLRYKDFTFYQASYAIDRQGREFSTLAVVKNSGRILPYVSCLMTFSGLLVHFLQLFHQALRHRPKY